MIILFDLDGTLIDSTDAILEGFHHSFDVYKCEHPSDEAIKALIGYPLEVMYSELGIETSKLDMFVTTYKEYYRVISCEKTELLKNAKEAVVLASQIAEIGIVTTKTGKYSQVIMEHFGIMDYFKVLIGREHVENPKPHEEPILKALSSFDTYGKEIWMIGDTKLDLISAKNAEVNSIGVLSGYGSQSTLEEHTNIVVKDALEAIKYLEAKKS
ncbi:MAG: hydrolase [Sulfurimonas sp.]|nr:MAG: hydrolase [Sulfurimonas sp.]